MGWTDDTGLAWSGARRTTRSGGFVEAVGLNQACRPAAVDPEGVVPPRGPGGRRGLALQVDRMDERTAAAPRNGRIRLGPR